MGPEALDTAQKFPVIRQTARRIRAPIYGSPLELEGMEFLADSNGEPRAWRCFGQARQTSDIPAETCRMDLQADSELRAAFSTQWGRTPGIPSHENLAGKADV